LHPQIHIHPPIELLEMLCITIVIHNITT